MKTLAYQSGDPLNFVMFSKVFTYGKANYVFNKKQTLSQFFQ